MFGFNKFFFYEVSTFIQQGLKLNWSKVTLKTFIMLQNIYISNKCSSFELSIHLWILKNKMYHSFHKKLCSTTFSTLIIIRNVSWATYYYDFWRSCDSEDWSNDAENTFDHRNKLQFNIYYIETAILHLIYFTILLIFVYIYTSFYFINAAFTSSKKIIFCMVVYYLNCLRGNTLLEGVCKMTWHNITCHEYEGFYACLWQLSLSVIRSVISFLMQRYIIWPNPNP